MSQLHFTSEDWKVSEGRYWSTFFNSISGPRSAVMIGTQDQAKASATLDCSIRLCTWAQIRPYSALILSALRRWPGIPTKTSFHPDATRIQHGTVDLLSKVHQTSAKYDATQDEFEEIGFEKTYIEGFQAPFIQGVPISCGNGDSREEHTDTDQTTRG